ncbi:MAG: hypothetical protein DSY57_04460 [Desulfobulbus sp.]|nr:MAG: hypothetical protein DSY57_04460 [Desulfobulbus sp.]
MNREQRQDRRIRFESRICIVTEDGTVKAEADSRDISLMGIYLVPEKKLPLNTFCNLQITIQGESSTMNLTVHGKVCRVDERGMGIAFVDMKKDIFIHIKNLIMLHTTYGVPKKPPTFPCQED